MLANKNQHDHQQPLQCQLSHNLSYFKRKLSLYAAGETGQQSARTRAKACLITWQADEPVNSQFSIIWLKMQLREADIAFWWTCLCLFNISIQKMHNDKDKHSLIYICAGLHSGL